MRTSVWVNSTKPWQPESKDHEFWKLKALSAELKLTTPERSEDPLDVGKSGKGRLWSMIAIKACGFFSNPFPSRLLVESFILVMMAPSRTNFPYHQVINGPVIFPGNFWRRRSTGGHHDHRHLLQGHAGHGPWTTCVTIVGSGGIRVGLKIRPTRLILSLHL